MRPRPLGVAVRAALLLFALWLYGGDLLRWIRAQSAGVTALADLPSLPLSIVGSLIAVAGVVVLALALRGHPVAGQRGLRLLTVALAALFFIDFGLLSMGRGPLTAPERLAGALDAFTANAEALGAEQSVQRDPAQLESLLDQLGPVPLFERGVRVARWKLELRERCAGPVLEAGAAGPGTFFYCVAGDHQRAWVTLVGLPQGETFADAPRLLQGAGWVGEVKALPPEPPPEPEEAPLPEQPVWPTPTEDAPE